MKAQTKSKEIIKNYIKSKYQSKPLGTIEDGYILDRIHDNIDLVTEYWKKV